MTVQIREMFRAVASQITVVVASMISQWLVTQLVMSLITGKSLLPSAVKASPTPAVNFDQSAPSVCVLVEAIDSAAFVFVSDWVSLSYAAGPASMIASIAAAGAFPNNRTAVCNCCCSVIFANFGLSCVMIESMPTKSPCAVTTCNCNALIAAAPLVLGSIRSEEHTSELQSLRHLVCRL